jgi:hypothetical protein
MQLDYSVNPPNFKISINYGYLDKSAKVFPLFIFLYFYYERLNWIFVKILFIIAVNYKNY